MDELKTEEQLAELLKNPDALRDHIGGIAKEAFGDVTATAVAEAETAVEAALKAHGVKRLPMNGDPNPDAPGAGLDGKWTRFGEFLSAIKGVEMGQMDARLKAMGEGAGAAGGFLVPEEFRAELLALSLEDAIVRPRAFTIPMASESLKIPKIVDTTHASSVFGGVVPYWLDEAGTKTASDPTFGQLQLVAKKLTGYTIASNELLTDSAIPLQALIMRLFSEALRFYEEDAFWNGNGAGQPLGILNSGALIAVGAETGQAATTIVYENLVKMFSRLLPRSVARSVWVANPDTFPQLATMALSVGVGGSGIWIANAVGGPPNSIFGRPLLFSEHCQTLGTQGDIYLVDLGYYVIGDRQALTVDTSMHVRFTTDETVWRFVQRLDGRPWLDSDLTPQHGATLSPFVSIEDRS